MEVKLQAPTIKVANQSVNLEHLALLLVELDKIHHNASPKQFPLFSLERRKADIQRIFDQGYIFYAENNSQILGFASILIKENSLVIEHLYVKPEFRHNKIGTEIIENIFSAFPDKEIFTTAYAFNTQAINFYDNFFELSSLVFKRRKF